MNRDSGFYSLIQFSPLPERMEFLNVGVLLVVPELGFVKVRFLESHVRLDRFFRKPAGAFIDALKVGLPIRLELEFERHGIDGITSYASKRANDVRLTPLLPVAVAAPQETLDHLFDELVGRHTAKPRRLRIRTRLRNAFQQARILELVDDKPHRIELPEAGIEISAPFGYQNGAFNLIDGMSLSGDRKEATKEAGQRAFEGRALAKHYRGRLDQKRLVIVGDFLGQPTAFYDAVAEQLEESNVRLYRLDNLNPLVDDIKVNALRHG